jgi:hypothetical protein
MHYDRESTGPGRHRYKVNARNLDRWRSDCYGGRVLSDEERLYFKKLRETKEPTPTEIVYRRLLEQRSK